MNQVNEKPTMKAIGYFVLAVLISACSLSDTGDVDGVAGHWQGVAADTFSFESNEIKTRRPLQYYWHRAICNYDVSATLADNVGTVTGYATTANRCTFTRIDTVDVNISPELRETISYTVAGTYGPPVLALQFTAQTSATPPYHSELRMDKGRLSGPLTVILASGQIPVRYQSRTASVVLDRE